VSAAAAPLSRPLPELIRRLRDAGFPVSSAEAVDAARLLAKLAERDAEALQAGPLRQHLRPLLCKYSDEESQQRFEAVFDEWWQRVGVAPTAPTPKPGTPPLSQRESPVSARRRAFWLGGLLLSLGLAFWRYADIGKTPPTPPPVKSAQPDTPGGNTPRPKATPSPQAPAQGPRVYGYWPAYRYTETLRPAVAWALVGMPFSLLLFFHLPAWALGRRRGGADIGLDGWERELAAQRLLPPLSEAVAGRFDRHFRGPARETHRLARRPPIDLPRTVQATVGKLGIPQLRHRHARLRPSYLVLVEADADDDFPMLWAERLQRQGVDVDLRRFAAPKPGEAAQAPRCLALRGGPGLRFDRLPNPGVGQRLILVSDGGFLLDEAGAWWPWARAARLERWPERALFSPREDRDLLAGRLAYLETGLQARDPGFVVLPQEESALAAWSAWLANRQTPPIIPAEAERFPRLIAEHGEARYLQEADTFNPQPGEVARLVGELGVYLGENGFYWLCCCAVPPLMRGGLTLLLGEEYLRRAGVRGEDALRYHLARNYRLLARLPWTRHNQMPDWLRLALLARLPPALQDEVRAAVEGLLSPLSPKAQGSLRLAFGAPGGLPTRKTALYLGFMDGLTASQLLARMPRPWRAWLARLERRRLGQRFKDWLAAGFARLLFKNGLKHQGPARLPLLIGLLWTLLSLAVFAAAVAYPPPRWPAALRAALLVEDAQRLGFRQEAAVRTVAYSPDGRRLLTVSEDNTARLWDVRTGLPVGQPMRHQDLIYQAVFSPDGQRVAVTGSEGTPSLWDARAGEPLGQLLGNRAYASHIAFSPDGQTIATAGRDNAARLWDAQTGRLLRELIVHGDDGTIKDAEFSPDGKRLATVNNNGFVALWDIQTDKLLNQMRDSLANSAQFSPDGTRLLTAGRGTMALLWNPETGQPVGEPLKHDGAVLDTHFSPDGQRIITASTDNTARLWDAQTGQPVGEPLKHDGAVWDAHFSPDGQRIITASTDNTARLWDAQTGQPIGESLRHQADVWQAEFSPDGQQVATADDDGNVRLWNAQIGEPVGEPMRHGRSINVAAYSPDGRRVVTASNDNTARLWDAQTGQPLGQPMRHEDTVEQAAFSPDGLRVVTASLDKTARLWDAQTGQPVGQPMRHEGSVWQASFSPDGLRVVTASADKTARLWDAQTGQPMIQPMRHEGLVSYAEFSHFDGLRVVTASSDNTARLWDAQTGQPVGQPMRHEGGSLVWWASFSPDGRQIVTASEDKTARLWDARTGQPVGQPMRHESQVLRARFSPDGQRVVTASEDNTARLWDAQTGQPVGQPMRHEDSVVEASFSPDGLRVVTASPDKTARLWDGRTGALLGVLPASDRVWSAVFHPDGGQVLIAGPASAQPSKADPAAGKSSGAGQSSSPQTSEPQGEARLWRIPPYPDPPLPGFHLKPSTLKTAVLAAAALAVVLERAGYLLSLRRLRRRVGGYAPRPKP